MLLRKISWKLCPSDDACSTASSVHAVPPQTGSFLQRASQLRHALVQCRSAAVPTPLPSFRFPEILKAFLGERIYKKQLLRPRLTMAIVLGKLTRNVEVKCDGVEAIPIVLGPLQLVFLGN